MKKKLWFSGILMIILLVGGITFANANKVAKKVDVMFLHDTQSHLNSFATVEDGKSQV